MNRTIWLAAALALAACQPTSGGTQPTTNKGDDSGYCGGFYELSLIAKCPRP